MSGGGPRTGPSFWSRRRVFVTGHTGFKGAWLAAWLAHLGADVTGYALPPADGPTLFTAARVGEHMRSIAGDVRDAAALRDALTTSRAEIVFHLAAQSLVRASYADPAGTYATNVMGTVHLLEAVRASRSVRAVVIVTSDKCYEPNGTGTPHLEADTLGGRDPYSSSKACAELVTHAYRHAFLPPGGSTSLATARAGNVIGGGDWAPDRLVPDIVRAFSAGQPARIRHPEAVRPWQHVLDALQGYLRLAERLACGRPVSGAWNFGPDQACARSVRAVADGLARRWEAGAVWTADLDAHPHETTILRLDSSRARAVLEWSPRLDLEAALDWTLEWYRTWLNDPGRAREVTLTQLARYEARAA